MRLKRIIANLLVITVIIMLGAGCTPKKTAKRTLPECFMASVEISYDDMCYEAQLKRLSDGCWNIELTAPEAVKGLVFDVAGEETEIGFKGLHFTFDTSKFPVGSVIALAVKSFDRLAPMTLEVTEGEASDFSSGEVEGMAYSLSLDKNGTPLTLDFGDSGMSIKFVSFEETEKALPEAEVTTVQQ